MVDDLEFGFDEIIERRTTPSIKWHWYPEEALPMWVADMDFRSPPAVIAALRERAAHGVYGYEQCPAALREEVVARLKRLYDWEAPVEALVFLPGVVPGFNLAIRAFTAPGDGVMIQTPIYPPILHAADPIGRLDQQMQLTQQADGSYGVEFDLFERTLTPETRMFLLCNPHNPVGRVFREDELTRMAEICLAHDLLICSDEIHGDLIFDGREHRPLAALDPEIAMRTITLMAPSKTFNIAGLHCAFAVIPNVTLRKRFQKARRGIVSHVNVMGYAAGLAAYCEGGPWLRALLAYLEGNRDRLFDYVTTHFPAIKIAKPEGTYLAWLDCREAGLPGNPQEFFLERGKVVFNDGAIFGPGGEGFVRLNFGCPRELLDEGLRRISQAMATLS
ncbi:MAG: putative C-S lyase [Chloroflexi bacterium]|jgi:cystathionine beta-lyase|nr:putative C-S lyase [Chloroflexota bacterium]